MLDTSLLPPVQIAITLAADAAVVTNFSSGVYDGMVEAMIQKQGFLEIPYKNYTMFQDTGNSIRWHASSASIDRLSVAADPAACARIKSSLRRALENAFIIELTVL